MAHYVLAYRGGSSEPPGSEAEMNALVAAWTAWFGKLGSAVVDAGNPFAASKTVASGGAVSDGGASALAGYSIVAAADIGAASELAKGCPILAAGGSVEVYEIHPMM